MLEHGFRLAAEDIHGEPSPEDAIWCLMREAMKTLQSQPDPEIGWLKAAERSCHPDVLREWRDLVVAAGRGDELLPVPELPPTPQAIDWMPLVMPWFNLVPRHGFLWKRRALLLWAGGGSPTVIANLMSTTRQTLHNVKVRTLEKARAELQRTMQSQ